MKELEIEIKTISPMLGASPADKEIYTNFIANKVNEVSRQEEIDFLGADEVIEKSMTIFPKDKKGNPILWDYQIKGFFKDACAALQRMKGEGCAKHSLKLKAYKKVIDGCVFVYPRDIRIKTPGPIERKERQLRAQTAQGERIALACSEMLPEGCEFTVIIRVPDEYRDVVVEWLNYGRYKGLLQWRNAGYGQFKYKIVSEIDANEDEAEDEE